MTKIKLSDYEFQGETLVKFQGMRIEYLGGMSIISALKWIAKSRRNRILELEYQIGELTGCIDEFSEMPCKSLQDRMEAASKAARRRVAHDFYAQE